MLFDGFGERQVSGSTITPWIDVIWRISGISHPSETFSRRFSDLKDVGYPCQCFPKAEMTDW